MPPSARLVILQFIILLYLQHKWQGQKWKQANYEMIGSWEMIYSREETEIKNEIHVGTFKENIITLQKAAKWWKKESDFSPKDVVTCIAALRKRLNYSSASYLIKIWTNPKTSDKQ